MANKVFSYDNGYAASTLSAQQVYIDINMDSDDAGNKIGNYIVHKYLLKEQSDEASDPKDKDHAILNTDSKHEDGKLIEEQCRITFLGKDEQTYEKALARLLKKAKYKIATLINVQAVQNSIRNIFTWIPGERILDPEFGSKLPYMLYEGITPWTQEKIASEIHRCINQWEPRVTIKEIQNLSTVEDTENNTIHIEVIYTIPSLTDDQLYSYPFVSRTTLV